MEATLRLLVRYPVKDAARAKALYGKMLGIEPYADQPYYVGYRIGDLEIGLDPNGHKQGMTGPISYWQVNDIKASLQALVAAGAKVRQEVTDVGGGKLTATVDDGDGNVVGLMQ